MKSIFIDVFNLKLHTSINPIEDFLSEIFAFCIQSYPELLFDFLRRLEIKVDSGTPYKVKTQLTLRKLSKHNKDSKPDIVIIFPKEVIIIESKISSEEGERQLKRYAEQVNEKFKNGTLVY